MDKLKLILIVLLVILAGFGLLFVIGFVYTLLYYIAIIAILAIGGVAAFHFFKRSDRAELDSPDPEDDLKRIERQLESYKKQLPR